MTVIALFVGAIVGAAVFGWLGVIPGATIGVILFATATALK